MSVNPSILAWISSKSIQLLSQEIPLNQYRQAEFVTLKEQLVSAIAQARSGHQQKQKYNDYYFQILIVELNKGSSSTDSPIKTTLITKRKKDLNDDFPVVKYNSEKQEWEKDKTIGDRLPSNGVIVKEDFLPIKYEAFLEESIDNLSKYPTVRFLLQTRRLSQLMAKTWLPEKSFSSDSEKDSVRCIREIFLSANLRPDNFDPHWNDIPSSDPETSYIIQPDWLNQEGIRLSLLLAGQAYLKVEGGYMPICDPPIFSTYETIHEYALKVSWDTFYASRVDLAQPGANAKPPYYEVTLGYPPRPPIDEFTSLTEEKIATWVKAPVEYGDSPFPFYPPKQEGKYVSDNVNYVIPPYPYIPMSCS